MKVAGFEPDEITYGLLIDGFCLAGRLDDAYRLLENELEYYDFLVLINSCKNWIKKKKIYFVSAGHISFDRKIIIYMSRLPCS